MKTDWLRNDYLAVALILLIALAVVFVPTALRAAPATSDTECTLWADTKPWAITRCESWETGEVCMVATSGFVVCKWED